MNLMTVEQISKFYGEKRIFENLSFGIETGDKIGVIGINGTGKSTLLKAIAGIEEVDRGKISRMRGLKTAYLPQTPVFERDECAIDYVLRTCAITDVTGESEAKTILTKIGIDDIYARCSELSGGQRKKIAIAAALMTQDTLPECFVIEKTGLGAGKREYEIPSILRAMVIEPRGDARRAALTADTVWKLECDIDDSTGEQLGYALEKLFEAGAREAHYTPVFMKKNRPGWELTVICDEANLQKMEEVIFTQTTTIGIRRQEMARTVLTRKVVNVQTRYGEIPVKVSGEGEFRRVHPEYEKVSEAASKYGTAFGAVYDEVLTNAYRNDDIS